MCNKQLCQLAIAVFSCSVTNNITRRVQSLQNAAARLITGARRRHHITPVLCQLHWLPVRRRVEFKLACLVRQALCGQMPAYLADDIHLISEGNRRSLLPLITCARTVPRTHNSFGDRSSFFSNFQLNETKVAFTQKLNKGNSLAFGFRFCSVFKLI